MLLTPQRPCFYARLSYAPDGTLEKVERQQEDGEATRGRLNWPEFCCVYIDNSRSAWQRNRKRPDWERMLVTFDATGQTFIPSDPKANHHHDGIMVYHGDRLIRQPYDLELLLRLADQRQIPLASVSGVRNLASEDDRFVLRIEAAQACRESANLSRRRTNGYKKDVVRHGTSQQGGKRPYGWGEPTGRFKTRRDKETGESYEVEILDYDKPVPEETKHLAEAAARLLAGASMNGALRYMNSVSTTTEGNPWESRVLWSVLTSPRISGLIEVDGVLYEAVWDEVIPEEDRQALIALREQHRKENPNPGPARVHLLPGALKCGRCDGTTWRSKPMGGKGRNKKPGYNAYRVYHCKQCNVARNVEHLDAYVTGRVLRLLNSPRFLRELQSAGTDGSPDVAAKIAALETRKAQTKQQIEELADHPDVDPALALLSLASFDKKIGELRNQMALTSRQRLLTRMVGISKDDWDVEPIDVRADTVRSLFEVVVLPTQKRGPGFDPASVNMLRKPLQAE
ncbi:recombinase family protein [Streptomyces cylindrosporus]|uniref:Recombinase family protein n=1 Tax=Streptomyces cylindrosporus TaxID=2927583 RepID=A0ABS9YJV7_9ACTN|nr:recombinase family protein [Streptomyces cylindrosporus]MCI3277455.1 recombinase family protein [Streptomyces cylindrosporus]